MKSEKAFSVTFIFICLSHTQEIAQKGKKNIYNNHPTPTIIIIIINSSSQAVSHWQPKPNRIRQLKSNCFTLRLTLFA